jgi:uncharacterized protein (TIGR03067 family)
MPLTERHTLARSLTMSKRLCVLLVCGFLAGADGAAKSDQNKKDLDQMQGKWQAVALDFKGTARGPEVTKKLQLVVKKDQYTIKQSDKDHVSAKLVLGASRKPKELDLVLDTGPVYKGIYEMDGDTLKVCLCLSSDAVSQRPTEFKGDEDANTALFTWTRLAP